MKQIATAGRGYYPLLMRVAAVVFDLFHTLTGRESEWSDLPLTSEILGIERRRWNELLTEHSRWRLAGQETDPFAIIATLARVEIPTLDDDVIRRAVAVRVRRFEDALRRIPAANVETLHRLRRAGLKLGLISNADVMEIAPWRGSPLAGLFDVEIFSCLVGHVKPEPAIYEACLNALGLDGKACMFVGDGGSDELAGARRAGMTPVFVSGVMAELWPERISERRSQSDHHVESIPELLELLRIT